MSAAETRLRMSRRIQALLPIFVVGVGGGVGEDVVVGDDFEIAR